MTDCWCGGDKKGYSKHVQRVVKTETCADSRQANAAYQRAYYARNKERIKECKLSHVAGWRPGTDVDLSEDAL